MSASETSFPKNTPMVTLVVNAEHPTAKFQIIPQGNGSQPLKTFNNQGDAVSWLLGQGYSWVTDTQPQEWIKTES
jgi:hypothetical protein